MRPFAVGVLTDEQELYGTALHSTGQPVLCGALPFSAPLSETLVFAEFQSFQEFTADNLPQQASGEAAQSQIVRQARELSFVPIRGHFSCTRWKPVVLFGERPTERSCLILAQLPIPLSCVGLFHLSEFGWDATCWCWSNRRIEANRK